LNVESTGARLPAKQVFAVVSGNALEFYDFVTYAFFAAQIGRAFFPSDEKGLSLLASLATFGVGFLTRPLGAFVIGRYADRVGRKPAMLLSFWLMGIAMLGLPLVPSYASIGMAAPILVIAFRLLQGFALGGEVGPSTAFLMEAAPPMRRGFYISLQAMSADVAVMVAGVVGAVLSLYFGDAALDAWGWRVALLLGVVIVPFGLVLRRTLDETLHRGGADLAPEAGKAFKLTRVAIVSLALMAAATTTNYLFTYMTTYASATLGMPTTIAFGATIVIGAAGVIFDPLGGWLSDLFGRRRVILIAWLIFGVLIFPCFWLLEHVRSGPALYLACGLLASSATLAGTTALVAITESLPRRVRAGGFGLIYATSIAVFGGSAQFNAEWLTQHFGSPMVPAWYMIGALVVGLIALSFLRETAPVKTGRVDS
jgi:MHS family citrate/tricarballylate:H+ symporter-like MFS transporter